jgi:hypothetical protein
MERTLPPKAKGGGKYAQWHTGCTHSLKRLVHFSYVQEIPSSNSGKEMGLLILTFSFYSFRPSLQKKNIGVA